MFLLLQRWHANEVKLIISAQKKYGGFFYRWNHICIFFATFKRSDRYSCTQYRVFKHFFASKILKFAWIISLNINSVHPVYQWKGFGSKFYWFLDPKQYFCIFIQYIYIEKLEFKTRYMVCIDQHVTNVL